MSNNSQVQNTSIESCVAELQDIANSHPDWWAEYEDAQIDIGSDRETLDRLLKSAPTQFAKGVVFGKIVFRQQIASLTGRPF